MKTPVKTMVSAALLAALTAVCSQIAIPLPWGVPLNLGTLSVFLAGALLGAKWGFISQLVYVLLGAVGVPVFSGFRGGLDTLAGPTGGYLLGYLLAALLVGLLVQYRPQKKWMPPLSMACGLAVCYAFGTAWFMILTGTGLLAALAQCVLLFLPGDAAKIAVASLVVARVGALRLRQPTQDVPAA